MKELSFTKYDIDRLKIYIKKLEKLKCKEK